MAIFLLLVTLIALLGLAYAWVLTVREVRAPDTAPKRRKLAWLSVLVVTGQVALFGIMSLFLLHNRLAADCVAVGEVALFLFALPCAIARQGLVRWWLILTSVYFMAFTGFVWVLTGIRF